MDSNTPNDNEVTALGRPDQTLIGARLREAREYLGLTQERVAERMGMSRAALSAVETGKRKVSGLELRSFAKVYGRPYAFFLGEEPNEQDASGVMTALFRTTSGLSAEEREQVLRFAQFLRHAGDPRRASDNTGEDR